MGVHAVSSPNVLPARLRCRRRRRGVHREPFLRPAARPAEVAAVTVYDNFSSGRKWHIEHHADDDRFSRGPAATWPTCPP